MAVTDAEFAAAMQALGPFEERPLVAVAVSGGPDSLALTLLADRWARDRGGGVVALSVDHRLRPESGAELVQLHGWLAARAIRHEIIVWQHDGPATGIQARAREARYRLLAGWCRAAGVLHLLVAHHRDDQVETHLIRRRAGSGIAGLAGMPAVRELAGCRLLRPLLGIPKARLVAFLAAAQQPFVSDPSNRDPRFERARLRERPLADDAVAAPLCALADCAAGRRDIEQAVAAVLGRAAAVHPAGFAVFDPAAVGARPAAIAEAALAALILTIGGGRYAPRRRKLARLRVWLGTAASRTSCGGCLFVPWRAKVLVLREPAHTAPPARLAPGACVCWDRRFVASLPGTAPRAVTLALLGRAGAAERRRRQADATAPVLPPLVHPYLPALWDAAGLLCVPHLGYWREPMAMLPALWFRPQRAVSGAGFTVV